MAQKYPVGRIWSGRFDPAHSPCHKGEASLATAGLFEDPRFRWFSALFLVLAGECKWRKLSHYNRQHSFPVLRLEIVFYVFLILPKKEKCDYSIKEDGNKLLIWTRVSDRVAIWYKTCQPLRFSFFSDCGWGNVVANASAMLWRYDLLRFSLFVIRPVRLPRCTRPNIRIQHALLRSVTNCLRIVFGPNRLRIGDNVTISYDELQSRPDAAATTKTKRKNAPSAALWDDFVSKHWRRSQVWYLW